MRTKNGDVSGWLAGAMVLVAYGCSGAAEPGVTSHDGASASGTTEEAADGSSGSGDGVSSPPEDADAGFGLDSADAGAGDRVPAETYCERTVDMFCGYYVRCGRMAVDSREACRTTFLEACNARYEPVYSALAARGALALSESGIAACEEHLERVACETQVNDLDGCPGLWIGLVPEGGACGLGIESFVCDDASVCVLGLDFCGRCKPLAGLGQACDPERRCPETADCVAGACVVRSRPGEPCGEGRPCAVGVACEAGRCALLDVRAVGEACGAGVRCQYRATCLGGVCTETGLLGDSCSSPAGCASGRCAGLTQGVAGTCVALLEPGEACAVSPDCRSGACRDGRCAGLVSACMP